MTFHKQQGSLHSRHTNKRSTRHDKRDKSRQQAEKERALHPYTLRSRTNSRSSAPTEGHSAMGSHKKGRFKSWQTKVLEDVLQAGIWHPGDATVALLVEGLKDRTAKQVRDWFSNIQRNVREGRQTEVKGRGAPDKWKTTALEALIMMRLQSNV